MVGQYRRGADTNGDDNLLDLLDDQPTSYNPGRLPAHDDDYLARQHNLPGSAQTAGRPSPYDDDLPRGNGGAGASVIRPVGGSIAGSSQPRPSYLGADNRAYSQTSDLHNYEHHAEIDDYPEDDIGDLQDYYGAGGLDDNVPAATLRHQSARNRNSILSLGGGLVGRARNMLGMGSQYSEMDLPLTDTAAKPAVATEPIANGHSQPSQHKSPQKPLGERIKTLFGQGEIDYSTLGPRIIYLNNSAANAENKYADNHISTSKYNVVTFLPKFLYEQFSKYSNLFFLFTAALQQIPNVSPTSRYTTIVPLIIVLIVSAIKEAVEDFRRKSADTALNNSKTRVLRGGSFEDAKWINASVGDVLRVESGESFPADLVLLASSEPEGLCYIETANLDGETNLKIKQALPETSTFLSPAELARLGGRLKSEQPNSSLYTYEATLTLQAVAGRSEKELPLQPDQLLLRGATLRNTPWIHGIVVFTGHETKLMRNATATPIKQTAVERMVNRQISYLALILITLAIVSTAGNFGLRLTSGKTWWYLFDEDFNYVQQVFLDLCTYWVLYSNLLPISLFVTIDIVKYCQAVLINSDLDMYYDKTDTPAVCRTSSLVEELGQVEYVFSDKTGTLTCNEMVFRQSTIAGMQYADDVPEDRRAIGDEPGGIHDFKRLQRDLESGPNGELINQFLTLLSTCHTVIPERIEEKPGEIRYQAASPDEGALVEGAAMLGYKFVARKPKSVTIQANGQELEYQLLAVCEFNSTRKRMSAIFRCPDGRIRCYCKGADTVILERLSRQNNPFVDITLQHLEEYAADGLRTLCLAMREIPDAEFREWHQVFQQAATTVGGNRADELDRAAEIIEKDFTLLGATAIEDRLQDGVPDTIHTLQTAGIKVWVLTGDRQETAINIGMSCKLISEDMTLLIVNEESSAATKDNLYRKLSAIRGQAHGVSDLESLALVIDGRSLTYALEKEMEKMFLDLAIMCKAVICW
jgi:phospholipid-transporting ATPase